MPDIVNDATPYDDLPVEEDTDIVKVTLVQSDGTELSSDTAFVEREVTFTKLMKIPLHRDGQLIPEDELANLGLTIRAYTRLEVETEYYGNMYRNNPTLAVRVRQYKAILDNYGLPINATSDQIIAAIKNDSTKTDSEKAEAAAALLALIHDIEINYQEAGGDGMDAWSVLPKLIKYLPVGE